MLKTMTDRQTLAWLWETGALYQFPSGRVLCVGATFAYFITADGLTLADIQVLDRPKSDFFLQRAHLRYTYQSRQQLLTDYGTGLFTPYFTLP